MWPNLKFDFFGDRGYNMGVAPQGIQIMVSKDKSYRFRLSDGLFEAARQKSEREDLSLAQVLRRFLRAWVAGQLELPRHTEFGGETPKSKSSSVR